jgi:hypothetical protein
MTRRKELLKLLEDDPFGLLQDVRPKVKSTSQEQQLIDKFEEITQFVEEHNREPKKVSRAVSKIEREYYNILEGIRDNNEKIAILKPQDRLNLLEESVDEVEITSFADMLANDPFGLLKSEEEDIFTLKHVSKQTTMPDYIANRKRCEDFENFKPLFEACQADIESGKRTFGKYRGERFIKKGMFFVLKGVVGYVAEMGEKKTKGKKTNARLRCIFSNGTESDMLLRSLSAELYKAGKLITQLNSEVEDELSQIEEEDNHDGYIYILKSLNSSEKIQQIKDLYKIGYSSTSVDERIANAKNEPTYLMAEVKKVATYKTYNMNPQNFEQLLHRFFGNSCLDIIVRDNNGKEHRPREWFVAPLELIKQAIMLIDNREIVNYRYDGDREEIVLRKEL